MSNNKELYDLLGIPTDASTEEVKKAYKNKSKVWHPDICKKPNAEEMFKLLQQAYEVLSDPDRRRRYDKTGLINKPVFKDKFHALVRNTFLNIVSGSDVRSKDIMGLFVNQTRANRDTIERSLNNYKSVLSKNKEAISRLTTKSIDKEESIFYVVLKESIEELERAILLHEEELNFYNEALEHLEEYGYNFDGGNFFILTATTM